MRLRPFLNRSETLALQQIERVLDGTAFRCYVKPRLKDVIESRPEERLSLPQDRMLRYGHLDFLVVDLVRGAAVFAIEFDGPTHHEPPQLRRDVVKDDICFGCGLPVLRIGTEEIALREQCSMLEWLLERFVDYRRIRPCLDRYDDAWDPQAMAAFDLDHAMPAIRAVLARLRSDFSVASVKWRNWGEPNRSAAAGDSSPLVVLPASRYLASLGLTPTTPPANSTVPSFRDAGEATILLCRKDPEVVVYEARQRVSITERHPTHGEMLDFIFGFTYEEAQASLAEYLALKDIERWAMRNLIRRAA